MTSCKGKSKRRERSTELRFTGRGARKIDVSCDGDATSSDAGLLLIREMDRKLG